MKAVPVGGTTERGRVVETGEVLEQVFVNFSETFTIGVCVYLRTGYEGYHNFIQDFRRAKMEGKRSSTEKKAGSEPL